MIYLINLAKDVDRLTRAKAQLQSAGLAFTRVDAKDASNLTGVSAHCEYFCTRGQIGCAQSHVECWKRIAGGHLEQATVMEDDVQLVPDFAEQFRKIELYVPLDFDILYLGYVSISGQLRGKGVSKETINEHIMVPSYPLGTHAYVLSKKGASKLLALFERDGINDHVDVQLNTYANELKVYAVVKHLAFQKRCVGDSNLATSQFPRSLNTLLDHIFVDSPPQTTLAYFLAEPIGRAGSFTLNLYMICAAMLLLFFRNGAPTTIKLACITFILIEFTLKVCSAR